VYFSVGACNEITLLELHYIIYIIVLLQQSFVIGHVYNRNINVNLIVFDTKPFMEPVRMSATSNTNTCIREKIMKWLRGTQITVSHIKNFRTHFLPIKGSREKSHKDFREPK